MPSDLDKILSLINQRTDLIDAILSALETQVGKSQSELRQVVEDFVSQLNVDDNGLIKNTSANRNQIRSFDRLYSAWVKESGLPIIKELVSGVNQLQEFNTGYFSIFTGKAELTKLEASTTDQIESWLGFTNRGGIVKNGYLDTLLKDQTIKNDVRNSVYAGIQARSGFFEMRKGLNEYIAGNKTKVGSLEKYARNFIYDTVAQVDRVQSKIMQDGLKLPCAVFEGSRRKKSSAWCLARKGKVFTIREISEFNPAAAGNSVPSPYNPFTDLGHYGCVDHLDYIPYAIGKSIRPDIPPLADCFP